MKIEFFPVGSPEFNAVEECWRQGKYNVLSNYYSSFSQLKQAISQYYRIRKFNLDIKKVSAEVHELMLFSISPALPCKRKRNQWLSQEEKEYNKIHYKRG